MKKFNLILSITALLSLSACAPLFIFGGATGAGTTLSKDKTVGSSIDDVNIWSKIKADFLKYHKEIPGILTNVSIEVSEGRVLLTGTVDSADDRLKVLRIAWDQAGVREVINELKIANDQASVKQYANDVWITTQVKSKMLTNKAIKSINYNVETIGGTVYILGIARSDEELQTVITSAEAIKGVHKVIGYIRVADRKDEVNDRQEDSLTSKNIATKPKAAEHNSLNNDDKVEYINPEESEEIIAIGQDSE